MSEESESERIRIYYSARMVNLLDTLRAAKEAGVSRLDLNGDGYPVRIEFAQPPQVFEVVTPKADEEQAEPGGYETALERMARGGKKEAPKT